MFIIENLLDTLRQILLKSVMLRHVTSHIDNFTASIVRVMMVSDFLKMPIYNIITWVSARKFENITRL